MKKIPSLFLSAFMALALLAACGKTQSGGHSGPADGAGAAQTPGTENTAGAGQAADDPTGQETPAAQQRPAEGSLVMMMEGMEETVPATLHTGSGWSIYIPQEGWQEEAEQGRTAWQSLDNDQVRLEVHDFGAVTLEEAHASIREGTQADWVEDKQGGLFAQTAEGLILEARFFTGKDGALLALTWQYPEEAAEGFGVRLQFIAEKLLAET